MVFDFLNMVLFSVCVLIFQTLLKFCKYAIISFPFPFYVVYFLAASAAVCSACCRKDRFSIVLSVVSHHGHASIMCVSVRVGSEL